MRHRRHRKPSHGNPTRYDPDTVLFKELPGDVKKLAEQSKKERRQKARAEWAFEKLKGNT